MFWQPTMHRSGLRGAVANCPPSLWLNPPLSAAQTPDTCHFEADFAIKRSCDSPQPSWFYAGIPWTTPVHSGLLLLKYPCLHISSPGSATAPMTHKHSYVADMFLKLCVSSLLLTTEQVELNIRKYTSLLLHHHDCGFQRLSSESKSGCTLSVICHSVHFLHKSSEDNYYTFHTATYSKVKISMFCYIVLVVNSLV